MPRVRLKTVHATGLAETASGFVVQVDRDWRQLDGSEQIVLVQVSPRATRPEIAEALRELADALDR